VGSGRSRLLLSLSDFVQKVSAGAATFLTAQICVEPFLMTGNRVIPLMTSLTTQPVRTPRQWDDFFSLKRFIYRDDPAAVFPLRRMEKQQVDRERNPFYQHAEMEAFVCYRDRQPVGRIAAIIDHMHQEFHRDDVGFFGFFESIDDQSVVHELLEIATQWVRERGCKAIRGPVNPSMKSEFGVLIEGHEFPPTIMMAHTPRRYDQQLQNEGFEVATQFFAFRVVFSQEQDECRKKFRQLDEASAKLRKRFPQLNFRPISAKNYEHALREINELGNQVRSQGWGFVPLTPAELEFMINNLRRVIRFDMIHVAYWDDHLVGYIVNIPDVNWALRRTVGKWDWLRMIQMPFLIRKSRRTRVIALGVDEQFRTKGIASLLIQQLSDRHQAFDEWEFSWVHEDNIKSLRTIERSMPLNQYKVYRLYQRTIESASSDQ
jgi:GNAT superfamily N-acetyltransferase